MKNYIKAVLLILIVLPFSIFLVACNNNKIDTYYTVTFNSNGGSKVSSQSVTGGFKITKPADPTRENYNFKGWYLNDKEFNFNTPITSNITLIAKWEEKE